MSVCVGVRVFQTEEIRWHEQRAFSSKQGGGQGQIFNLKINNVSLAVLL